MKPIHIVICAVWLILMSAGFAQAQTPVNIRQVGDVSIGSTLPISTPVGSPITAAICTGGVCVTITAANALKVDGSGVTGSTAICTAGVCVNITSGNALQEDLTSVGGTALATGAGVAGTNTPRFAIANNSFTAGNPATASICSAGVCVTVTASNELKTFADQGAAGTTPWPVTFGVLTTAYAGTAGMTVITSGTTSVMTATTTNVPSIECNNISAAGANTVTIMDGNGKYFLGPNFSIPASSNQIMNWNGGARFTSGINISAGAANVIQCEVSSGSTQ